MKIKKTRKKIMRILALSVCIFMLLGNPLPVQAGLWDINIGGGGNTSGGNQAPTIISETRMLGAFNSIEVGGTWVVTYVHSPLHMIRTEIPSYIVGNYSINIRSQTLQVQRNRNFVQPPFNTPSPRIYIFAPTLQGVNLSGAAVARNWSPIQTRDFTIHLSGVTTAIIDVHADRNVAANVSGVSNLSLSGRADTVTMNISGVSTVRAFNLQARDARTINVSGTSTVEITASDRLGGQVSGIGMLRFRGNPTLSVRTSGLGRVMRVK